MQKGPPPLGSVHLRAMADPTTGAPWRLLARECRAYCAYGSKGTVVTGTL